VVQETQKGELRKVLETVQEREVKRMYEFKGIISHLCTFSSDLMNNKLKELGKLRGLAE